LRVSIASNRYSPDNRAAPVHVDGYYTPIDMPCHLELWFCFDIDGGTAGIFVLAFLYFDSGL
jgi:hypothetical protein